ncbi:MAG: hypothetical protein ACOCV2_05600, partial [Persicimonas sp.]
MAERLHLIPGRAAAGSAANAFPNETVAHLGDVLTEGPVEPLDTQPTLRDWLRARYGFSSSRGGAQYARARSDSREEMDAFCDVFEQFDDFDEVVVWAADGLGENLMACWFRVAADVEGYDLSKLRIASPGFQDMPPTGVYLGACAPENFARGNRRPWSDSELRAARRAWEAFTAPTPEPLLELISEGLDVDLLDPLPELLGRYPSAETGLDVWEEQLLRRLADHTEPTARTIGEVLGRGWEQSRDHIGDAALFDRVLELSDPSIPRRLLHRWGTGSSLRTTYFALTEHGRDVLEGAEHRVDAMGLERWIGGVHLDSTTGSVWSRRASKLELVSYPNASRRVARAASISMDRTREFRSDRQHLVVGRGYGPLAPVVHPER